MDKKNVLQMVKFTLFSISAGVIQGVSFSLFNEVLHWQHWLAYLTALVLSVLWNFTLNRRYTFQSAANVPIAMAKLAVFYLVFTPLSTWFVDVTTDAGLNEYIALAISMIANFVLEFLYSKFFMYRGQEYTR